MILNILKTVLGLLLLIFFVGVVLDSMLSLFHYVIYMGVYGIVLIFSPLLHISTISLIVKGLFTLFAVSIILLTFNFLS